MDLFTYLMAKNEHNTSINEDLFAYLLGKAQGGGGQIKTASGITINIPDAKKLVSFMMTKESTQDNIAYVDVGSWEQGTINSSTGLNQDSDNAVRTVDYIKVYPNVLYSLSRTIYTKYMGFRFYDENKNYLGSQAASNMVETNQNDNRMYDNVSSMTMTILNTNVAYMKMFDNSNDLSIVYTMSTEDTPSPDYPQEVNVVEGYRNLFDKDNANILNAQINSSSVIRSGSSNRTTYINAKPNTTYTITKLNTDSSFNFFVVGTSNVLPAINGTVNQRTDNKNGKLITLTTDSQTNYLVIWFYNTGDNVTEQQMLDSIMIVESNQELPYVPYGNNYILYKQVGKNLCPTKEFTSTSSARMVGTGSTIYGIPATSGTTYVASFDVTTLPSVDYRVQFVLSSDSIQTQSGSDPTNRITTQVIACSSLQRYSISLTASENGYLYIRCVPAGFVLNNIQVEEGSTATEYEAYKETQVSIPLNNNIIAGIGDYKDELKVDKSGNVFINKKTGKVVLDGTEDWTYQLQYTRFIYNFGDTWNAVNINTRLFVYMNYFHYLETGRENGAGYLVQQSIYLYNFNLNNVSDFKSWLSTHNIEVYYPLETPELINLQTKVDIELFKGVNNISNSEDGYMTIEYK